MHKADGASPSIFRKACFPKIGRRDTLGLVVVEAAKSAVSARVVARALSAEPHSARQGIPGQAVEAAG
jgi:hypothetical protein